MYSVERQDFAFYLLLYLSQRFRQVRRPFFVNLILLTHTNHYPQTSLNCLKASSNAEYIAAGFADSFVKLWSVQSTKPDVPAAPPTNLIGHSGAVFSVDFSPDGDYLLSGSEDKTGMI